MDCPPGIPSFGCCDDNGPQGAVNVQVKLPLIGCPPFGPDGKLIWHRATTFGENEWEMNGTPIADTVPLQIWNAAPHMLHFSGDLRAPMVYQLCIIEYEVSAPVGGSGPDPWSSDYGSAAGTTNTLRYKWTYTFDHKRNNGGPVEIIGEAAHFGGIFYWYKLEEDGTANTLVNIKNIDGQAPSNGLDQYNAIDSGGTASDEIEYSTFAEGEDGRYLSNVANREVHANYPGDPVYGNGPGGFTGASYYMKWKVTKSNAYVMEYLQPDPETGLIVGGSLYNDAKEILDRIDLNDLSKTYSWLDPAGKQKLEFHKSYLISFYRPNGVGPVAKWIMYEQVDLTLDPFGFPGNTTAEYGGPNGDAIDASSQSNFKVLADTAFVGTDQGATFACMNVQEATAESVFNYWALRVGKTRFVENVGACAVQINAPRSFMRNRWDTPDDGFPILGVEAWPHWDVGYCVLQPTGDVTIGPSPHGIMVILRRFQIARYEDYFGISNRPPCWNWPPACGCNGDI